MKLWEWVRDKLVPPLIVGLLYTAVALYIDVQMLKREMASLRAELTDLWVQANDQIQKGGGK